MKKAQLPQRKVQAAKSKEMFPKLHVKAHLAVLDQIWKLLFPISNKTNKA
jgi:hypothetical protein